MDYHCWLCTLVPCIVLHLQIGKVLSYAGSKTCIVWHEAGAAALAHPSAVVCTACVISTLLEVVFAQLPQSHACKGRDFASASATQRAACCHGSDGAGIQNSAAD